MKTQIRHESLAKQGSVQHSEKRKVIKSWN